MEKIMIDTPQESLSPKMTEWLKLRRALEDRITGPELSNLLHKFMAVDLELFKEEIQAAYERGLAADRNS